MKKILLSIVFVVIALTGYSRQPYTDSIDVSEITAADSVYYIALNRASFGSTWSIEFEYSTLNANDGTLAIGASNWGNTFNLFYGTASKTLNVQTDTVSVNGNAPNVSVRVFRPATFAYDAGTDPLHFNYLAIKVTKGSATTGKIYYIIRQK